MKVFVVGAGMAGHALVEELLKAGQAVEIHLFGEERSLPYNRIFLSDIIAGRKLPSQLILKSYQRYEEEGVKLHLGERMERIFPDTKKIITSRGSVYSYDRLVLALGSVPSMPPVKGVEKKGVFTFRNMGDVYGILEMARVSKRAVVIGGGLLGVELSSALREAGLDVSLVHILDRLMEQWLDETASRMLSRKLEGMGIRVLLGSRTVEVMGERKAEGIRLSNGEVLEGDFVVFATGVRPNTSLAVASGLKVNRGILVNDFLETSAQD
ncbi:MAG: NAD(P)/FAD-dependent oxidoreductase, partial [Aquificota bacterium]